MTRAARLVERLWSRVIQLFRGREQLMSALVCSGGSGTDPSNSAGAVGNVNEPVLPTRASVGRELRQSS